MALAPRFIEGFAVVLQQQRTVLTVSRKGHPMSVHSYSRCWLHLSWVTWNRERVLYGREPMKRLRTACCPSRGQPDCQPRQDPAHPTGTGPPLQRKGPDRAGANPRQTASVSPLIGMKGLGQFGHVCETTRTGSAIAVNRCLTRS